MPCGHNGDRDAVTSLHPCVAHAGHRRAAGHSPGLFPGSSAYEVENSATRPLRQQLLQVAGLKEIQSESRMDVGTIRLVFEPGSDMDIIFIEVNEKVDRAMRFLPEGAERPKVMKASAMDIPAFYLDMSLREEAPLTRAGMRFAGLGRFAET